MVIDQKKRLEWFGGCKKYQLLKDRFHKRVDYAQKQFGYVSLESLVRCQYYFPTRYNFEPKKTVVKKESFIISVE